MVKRFGSGAVKSISRDRDDMVSGVVWSGGVDKDNDKDRTRGQGRCGCRPSLPDSDLVSRRSTIETSRLLYEYAQSEDSLGIDGRSSGRHLKRDDRELGVTGHRVKVPRGLLCACLPFFVSC